MDQKDSYLTKLRYRLNNLNVHYKSSGFYKHIGITTTKIIVFYVVFIVIIFLISKYLINFKQLINFLIDNITDKSVLILFTVSESILGLIPPDIFVVWTAKFDSPMPILFLLGVLSFIGGIISFFIGWWVSKRPKIEAYLEPRLQTYITLTRKWGGAFIILAALLPFSPFAIVCIAIGVLRYPFTLFLVFALSRTLRFVLQGFLFFDMLNLDTWLV
ncbi:MAG: VTT domain-containing protein [Desulfobacteraceae bacterium]|nr:VTT domain-containing protein [Desulfobacteraceae bacterium]